MKFEIKAGQNVLGYVKAVPAVYAGVYVYGMGRFKPNHAEVRALIDHRWRKAFDRASGFWFDKKATFATTMAHSDPGTMDLYDSRKELLAALECRLVWDEEQ